MATNYVLFIDDMRMPVASFLASDDKQAAQFANYLTKSYQKTAPKKVKKGKLKPVDYRLVYVPAQKIVTWEAAR